MSRGIACLALVLAVLAPAAAGDRSPNELTVFAAASLTEALGAIGERYTRETGVRVRYSFAASSALAHQIESGAPADVLVSADVEWMNFLESKGLVDRGSRRDIAGNALVLIAPGTSDVRLEIAPGFGLAAALGRGRLAIGNPAAVPAGRYARAALVSLGVWPEVESRLAPAESVRAALAWVSRGEAPLGIVYRTDARIDRGVRVVAVFPADAHPPIVYPAAALSGSRSRAPEFVAYLGSATARAIFSGHGFTAPAGAR